MKIFILRNASVNRLLDKELERLMDAEVEFAITDNNGKFGIDNTPEESYGPNMNTLIFIWSDYYNEEKQEWDDKLNNCINVIADIIKPIFEFYAEVNEEYMEDYNELIHNLNYMKRTEVVIYDISQGVFIR